jgi:hypothetical protein
MQGRGGWHGAERVLHCVCRRERDNPFHPLKFASCCSSNSMVGILPEMTPRQDAVPQSRSKCMSRAQVQRLHGCLPLPLGAKSGVCMALQV